MSELKYNYDQEGDVLYISFGRSEHVVGVELGDHLLLRLDTGKGTARSPRAVGLTILFPAQLLALGHAPTFTLERLERLPADLRAAVLEVLSKSPVSELLSVRLTLAPEELRIPELVAAYEGRATASDCGHTTSSNQCAQPTMTRRHGAGPAQPRRALAKGPHALKCLCGTLRT